MAILKNVIFFNVGNNNTVEGGGSDGISVSFFSTICLTPASSNTPQWESGTVIQDLLHKAAY